MEEVHFKKIWSAKLTPSTVPTALGRKGGNFKRKGFKALANGRVDGGELHNTDRASQKKFRPAALGPSRPGALPAADPPPSFTEHFFSHPARYVPLGEGGA